MSVEKDLDVLEDGYETEAEQIDEATEIEDVESFLDDEVMDPTSLETDLEQAYDGFTANEDGETVPNNHTHDRLVSLVEDEVGLDLSEEGFHVEGPKGKTPARNLVDEGTLDEYDADELTDDTEEVTEDEPDDSDYGYDVYEMEVGDDDIAYYITDEDDNEIGFAIIENGKEVEYYYVTEGDDEDDEAAGVKRVAAAEGADDEFTYKKAKHASDDDDVIEMEVDEDDIAYYLVDEDDNTIGFVVIEDGNEVEYYYATEDEGNHKKSKHASGDGEYDFGITREGVAEATSDMNTIYKEGAQTVAELKGAYDDIMSAFDFKSMFKK